ncbi:DNA/RNA polymerase, partial [Exidia glandulosa HHB12029]
MEDFVTSPLGCAVRAHSGKRRLINHLSWPHGDSVNDGIPDSEASIVYDAFDKAMCDLVASGPGTLMSKLDLTSAFHHVPLRRADWNLIGWEWAGQFYHALTLIFGLRSAPYVFNLFAEALHWIIARHVPARHRHYLDDFLQLFAPSTDISSASAAVEWIVSLGSTLGLRFSPEKTIQPTTCIEFLGLELDSIAMEARVPRDKLDFVKSLLSDWSVRRSCTLRELQTLTGYLQFIAQVIPYARAFLRRLFDAQSRFSHALTKRTLSAAARQDVLWWATYVEHWNGVHLLDPPRQSFEVFTDASGTKGLGGHFVNSWYASRCPRRMRSEHIQVKEMYAVLQAILRWGDRWRDGHVLFHVDNMAVFYALQSHTSDSPGIMR